ncbi:MAG: hypothetical protein WBO49_01960, partial [Candidatus Saccharimonas sp.]
GKLTGNVLVSPTLDNRGVDVRTPFAVTVTDGSGESFTSPQNLQPGELRPLEPSAFPAGGDFSVVIKANGVKVFSDTFNTDSCKLPVKIKVTAVNGTFTDECGPDFNLKFTPAVTEGVKYVETTKGNTVTVTAEVTDAGKYELTNPDWTQSKTDGLEACPVVKIKVTAVNGVFTDLCGSEYNVTFKAAVTEGVEYVQVREGNTLKVTAKVTDSAKYELTNPDWTQSKTDGLEACPVVTPTASLVVRCDKIDGEKTGWVEAELTLDNTQFESSSVFLVKTSWPGDKVDSELVVGPQATETFYGYFPAGGVIRNVVYWEGKVILEQTDSTQQCVVKDEPTPKPTPTKKPTSKPTKPSTGWKDKKDRGTRGLPKDTGPGEEFVVASPFASPAILVGVGVGVVLIGVIAAGVVYLRRREV